MGVSIVARLEDKKINFATGIKSRAPELVPRLMSQYNC